MPFTARRSKDRGFADHGWLKSFHSFSFAGYYDPNFMGFRDLRVLNEDRILGGEGFPTHGHRDMEIISYVMTGALEHSDSMGNKTQIKPGEVQRMSAGTGVQHSEYNASRTDQAHFLQIWILPKHQGRPPGYEQKSFLNEINSGVPVVVASPDGRNGSVTIDQDVEIQICRLKATQNANFKFRNNRYIWLQVISGTGKINDLPLSAGDAVSATGESELNLNAESDLEVMIFDLV